MGRDIRNGRVKLRGLTYSTSRDGTRHYYLRRKGQPKIRLGKGPIDSPEFLARYADAAKSNPTPARAKAGSLRGVVDAFMASTTWETYSRSYKTTMNRHLSAMADLYGTLPFHGLEARHIRADMDKLKPHAAADRLKAWRNICTLAADRGWHTGNPAETVKRGKTPKTDGHLHWDADHIATYRKRWPIGTVQRLCFELVYWSAARTVDAVKLSPSMVKGGVLEFTQQKTGGKAYLPWSCALPAWAAEFEQDRAYLTASLQSGVFTYLEAAGKVRSAKGLSNLLSAAARKAGFARSAHGLRKSRLTAIAEAGGSVHAIMSWGGHKTMAEAQEYIKTADQRRVIMSTTEIQSVHTGKK